MIVVYYIDCAPIFFFCLFMLAEYMPPIPASKLSGVPDNARGVMGCS